MNEWAWGRLVLSEGRNLNTVRHNGESEASVCREALDSFRNRSTVPGPGRGLDVDALWPYNSLTRKATVIEGRSLSASKGYPDYESLGTTWLFPLTS